MCLVELICFNILKMKQFFFILVLLIAWPMLQSCENPASETIISGESQGTTYHIKFVLDKGLNTHAKDIQKHVAEKLADIDAKLSNYRPDSEISLLNENETTEWLIASKEVIDLLAISKVIYLKSNGCFDLTVKPLFDLWDFSRHEPKVPTQADIDALRPHTGMNLLEIDQPQNRFRKKDPKLKIDLSSIAQGYSAGQVADSLEKLGIQNYMVEIGGEMMVKGRKANGGFWRVGIESPNPEIRSLYKAISINNPVRQAVMTAGTYRNYFEADGKSYPHILNPKTGWPVSHHLRSVTVIHDDPSWADAWDTALLCLGEEAAIKTIESENLKAFLIYEANHQYHDYTSKAFNADSEVSGQIQ